MFWSASKPSWKNRGFILKASLISGRIGCYFSVRVLMCLLLCISFFWGGGVVMGSVVLDVYFGTQSVLDGEQARYCLFCKLTQCTMCFNAM